MLEASDVALAEFTALRAEILAMQEWESRTFTAALTVIAAVGSFAVAKTDGRLELLLVLPVVLSGLGLLQAQWSQQVRGIGDYLRDCLWPRLPAPADGRAQSWEHYFAASYTRIHGAFARILIFVVPSIASRYYRSPSEH
jgi:hypothetical protein